MDKWEELTEFLKSTGCGIDIQSELYAPYHLILPDNERFLLGPTFTLDEVKEIYNLWLKQNEKVEKLIKETERAEQEKYKQFHFTEGG